jgi:hypothetical protein
MEREKKEGVINSFIDLIIEKILPSPTRRGAGGEVCFEIRLMTLQPISH